MTPRLAAALAHLEDPAHYVVRRAIPVFDEHAEYDENGKLLRDFDRGDLEKIAAKTNRRDATGSFCPLVIGHTTDDPREDHQPPIVGYARHFRVKYVPDLQRYALLADYYLRKDDYDEAQTYPRSSVELWPEDDILDPIALLRRTPDRDLGQWTYSRHGQTLRYARRDRQGRPQTVIRYSMESPMADYDAGTAPEDAQMDHVQQFLKHIAGHPMGRQMLKYAAEEQPEDMPSETPEDDTLPPAPDQNTPAQYAADEPLFEDDDDNDDDQDPTAMPEQHAAALAAPTATNGAMPDRSRRACYGKDGKRLAADSKRIKARRMEDRVAQLEAENRRFKQAARYAKAEQRVTQLEAEGYVLDRAEEVNELMARPGKSWDAYEKKVRQRYQRSPVSTMTTGGGLIPVAREDASTTEPNEEGLLPARRAEQVYRYQKAHKFMAWEQAAKECPANY